MRVFKILDRIDTSLLMGLLTIAFAQLFINYEFTPIHSTILAAIISAAISILKDSLVEYSSETEKEAKGIKKELTIIEKKVIHGNQLSPKEIKRKDI